MGRYEQPEYTVVATGDGYEIRDYESHLVAETTVEGDFDTTGNVAFGRLAGFIFGRNSAGEKMNMTVPVTHLPLREGGHRYRFVMERAYTEESLPRPVDGSVTVVRVPGGHYAADGLRAAGFEQAREPLGIVPTARSFDDDLDIPWVSANLYYTMADADLV